MVLDPCLGGVQTDTTILNDGIFDALLRLSKSQVVGICHTVGHTYDDAASWAAFGREVHRRACVVLSAAFLAGATITFKLPRGCQVTGEAFYEEMVKLTGSTLVGLRQQDANASWQHEGTTFHASDEAFSVSKPSHNLIRKRDVQGQRRGRTSEDFMASYFDIAEAFLTSSPEPVLCQWEDAITRLRLSFVEKSRRRRKDGRWRSPKPGRLADPSTQGTR